MQSIFVYSQGDRRVDRASLYAFLQENGGQLESLFENIPTLAENPTSENIIAIIESYIQMNRVIASIITVSEVRGLSKDDFAKYRQSIDPTLSFLLQVKDEHQYISAENALKESQGNYDELHESILTETEIWLKQHMAQLPAAKAAVLLKLVNSEKYTHCITCLKDAESEKYTLPAALVLMLNSFKRSVSENTIDEISITEFFTSTVYSVKQTIKEWLPEWGINPKDRRDDVNLESGVAAAELKPDTDSLKGSGSEIADYYLKEFMKVEGGVKFKRLQSTSNRAELLEWMDGYLQNQLANLVKVKPKVSVDKVFLHRYRDVSDKEPGYEECTVSILGLFLGLVQRNFLKSHLEENSKDIAHIMRKLVMPRHSFILVQEMTEEDMKFLARLAPQLTQEDMTFLLARGFLQAQDSYSEQVILDLYNMTYNLKAAEAKELSDKIMNLDVVKLANSFAIRSGDAKYGAVYAIFKAWLEHLVYFAKLNAEGKKTFNEAMEGFDYFHDNFNLSLVGSGHFAGDAIFIKREATPYKIQTTNLYNSERYNVVPVTVLREALFRSNIPTELFADILAMAHMQDGVIYKEHELNILDLVCEQQDLKEILFTAILSGDVRSARNALNYNADLLDKTNEQGLSPLKAAIVSGDLSMVKFILSNIITRNKSLNITSSIPLPLQFTLDHGKKAIAEFFGQKLDLTAEEVKARGLKEENAAKSKESVWSMEKLASMFKSSYVVNNASFISDFLCKIACASVLMWLVGIVMNNVMMITIFAYLACVPLLAVCGMHACMNSLYFESIVDAFAIRLVYFAAPNSKVVSSPEMVSSYTINVMPKVAKQLNEIEQKSSGKELGIKG